MKKPKDYPTAWKSDVVAGILSGPELIKVTQDINAVYACGSQVPILDTQFLPHQSHNLANKLIKILGIKQEIEIIDVIKHFNILLQNFTGECSPEVLSAIDTIALTVYQFLNKKLNTNVMFCWME